MEPCCTHSHSWEHSTGLGPLQQVYPCSSVPNLLFPSLSSNLLENNLLLDGPFPRGNCWAEGSDGSSLGGSSGYKVTWGAGVQSSVQSAGAQRKPRSYFSKEKYSLMNEAWLCLQALRACLQRPSVSAVGLREHSDLPQALRKIRAESLNYVHCMAWTRSGGLFCPLPLCALLTAGDWQMGRSSQCTRWCFQNPK